MHDALHNAALLFLLTMTGNEICVAAFVEPSLRALPGRDQRPLVPGIAALLGRVMPIWYAVSLLCTGAYAWITRSADALASLGVQLLILVGTLTMLVPINNKLAHTELASEWLRDAMRWDTLHRVRVGLLTGASILLLLAG